MPSNETVPKAAQDASEVIPDTIKKGPSKDMAEAMARLKQITTRKKRAEREIFGDRLPPPEASEEAANAPEGVTLLAIFSRKIVRYGDIVVKSDPKLVPTEAATMRFIAENTSIPVPRVYEETIEPVRSITMEYIDGQRLDLVWNSFSAEQKIEIADQLHGMLSELRSLKGQYIGSLDHGKAFDTRRFDFAGGPFSTEEEFNDFLLSDTYAPTPQILRDIARRSLRSDHEIVFTHGDFAPRNILVKDTKVVGLIDWEFAGWYPEYWEFVKTFNAADHRKTDWHNYVGKIFPKCYETEYINDRFLGSILGH